MGPVKYLEESGSGLDSALSNTGTLSSVVAWKKEGRYLRGRDVRRIPYVGNWLAEHVPRWRDDSPRKKAAGAAARRAKVRNPLL
jgi:hypothetical protein